MFVEVKYEFETIGKPRTITAVDVKEGKQNKIVLDAVNDHYKGTSFYEVANSTSAKELSEKVKQHVAETTNALKQTIIIKKMTMVNVTKL